MMTDEEKRAYMGKDEKDISTLDKALSKMYEEQIKNFDFDTFLIFDSYWYSTKEFLIDARDWHGASCAMVSHQVTYPLLPLESL